jgi:hypothetical protein
MIDALVFWLMKPLAEIAFALGLILAVMLVYGLACLPGYLKRRRCKHEQVWEDGQCNARCRACGKNLGFIGTWREKRRA